MSTAQIFIEGSWQSSAGSRTFQAVDPRTGESFGDAFPVSTWDDLEKVLAAAAACDRTTRDWTGDRFAALLDAYAEELEARREEIVKLASQETALPVSPRLNDAEFPRTVNQLKTAAGEARDGGWSNPIIDSDNNIRSMYRSIGPVFVIGPNNFPLAFNGISGGDFAAAIAAGNPVIAKAHPAHPGTSRLLAECIEKALNKTGFPAGFVQMIYDVAPEDGLRMIRDPRLAAVGFTGSQKAGVAIKEAADALGKPVYVEMSSINPVFILPGYLEDSGENLVNEFSTSCLMGSGQFCTNPGLVVLPPGDDAPRWIDAVRGRFAEAAANPLLAAGVKSSLLDSVQRLVKAGAELLTGGQAADSSGFVVQNTLLKVDAESFLKDPETFQQEAFGNASLLVTTNDVSQMAAIADVLEGQLTGVVYTTEEPGDEAIYRELEPVLRRKVGRLLNNKMPTGVAVSPAMNHGGPFPATGHPGFTAVGLPASIRRFAMLECYDNVPEHRLPAALRTS